MLIQLPILKKYRDFNLLFWKLPNSPIIRIGTAMFALLVVAILANILTNKNIHAQTNPSVTITENTPSHPVPSSYIGFSIDPANLCYVLSLAQSNPSFVQLFKNIGPGVLRVGGNTGDTHASWSTTATSPTCKWNGLVMTPSLVSQFFNFAQSIGYKVMWQVPMNNGNPAMDASEAAYVSTMPDLYSIEIGNEPNFYPDSQSNYQTYINNWLNIYNDYKNDGGTAPISGPSSTVTAKWYITPFLNSAASDLVSLTGHWYVGSASSGPTCNSLIQNTGVVWTASGVAQGKAYNLPYILNETNTYTGYGQQGVSNAFCSAIWAADNTLNGLVNGVQGMYFHGTADYPPGNSAGQPQYYTPINEDGSPAPEYYGMLFYYEMAKAGGNQVGATISNSTNVDAFAVAGSDSNLRVAIVNRNSTPITTTINTANSYTQANEICLSAPSLNSLSGVTLGGTSVGADGTWSPNQQSISVSGNSSTVTIPAYTGEIVTYAP